MAGQTPTVQQLCDAAQAGDLAQVEEILAQNALLARQPITQNGQLAIQFAAREGYAEIVAALLAAGADPRRGVYPNRRATSALAYARARGYSKIVALIEDFLARQPAAEPATGPGPALFAAAAANDLDQARALRAHGRTRRSHAPQARAGQRNPLGGRPSAAMSPWFGCVTATMCRAWIRSGRFISHCAAGETSHWADAEKLPFAELLIDYGADLETRDDELQSTPLGHACRYGLAKLAALLLEHGASVEPLAGAPWTAPLAWAEQQGHAEIAALLQSRT